MCLSPGLIGRYQALLMHARTQRWTDIGQRIRFQFCAACANGFDVFLTNLLCTIKLYVIFHLACPL